MKTFWQLTLANAKDILRDKMSLFWFLAFPLLFVVLYGFIFANIGVQTMNIGVVSAVGSPTALYAQKVLTSIESFNIHEGTLEDELAELEKGKRSLVLDLSPVSLGESEITTYYDETKGSENQMAIAAVRLALAEAERIMTGQPRVFSIIATPITRTDVKEFDRLLPGILAMALMQLGIFGSMRTVSLRERKILKALGATPIPRTQVLASEIVVRLMLAVAQALLIVLVSVVAFGLTIVGSWLSILGAVLLGALTFVSLGYFLASFPKTQEAGVGIAQIVQFPMMFLSGIFIPIEIMPKSMKPVFDAIPLTYLGDLLRQIMVGAPPVYSPWVDVAVLLAWTVGSFILAIKFWRWE